MDRVRPVTGVGAYRVSARRPRVAMTEPGVGLAARYCVTCTARPIPCACSTPSAGAGLARRRGALAEAEADVGHDPRHRRRADRGRGRRRRTSTSTSCATGIAESQHPLVPLIRALVERCGEAGACVHWGVTTQDIIDTGADAAGSGRDRLIRGDLIGRCAAAERLAPATMPPTPCPAARTDSTRCPSRSG